MNIFFPNEYRLEVLMNTYELSEFGISYEDIDYKSIETRRFLWSLLDKVRSSYGVNFSLAGRHLIEVIREKENKLRICFSQLSQNNDQHSVKQLIKSEILPVAARFSCFEDVLSAVSVLPEDTDAALYENNGKYMLIFTSAREEKNRLLCRLCEFSDICEEPLREKARCEELWRCIIPQNAVNKLMKAFSVNR